MAVDDDWSALRFRRAELVAGRDRRPADPVEVQDFLAALPEDRRPILQRVHEVIRTAAPQLTPAVAGGMLGYGPFHYRYATGREGDTYVVSLASQKRYVSLYLNATADGAYLAEANAGRLGNVSVGKSCVRFKKLEDLDLVVLAELVRRSAELTPSSG